MTKLNILLLFLVSSFSGCWLGNDFSSTCTPSACAGTCQDNICIPSSTGKTDTGNDLTQDVDVPDIPNDVATDTCQTNEDCPVAQICNAENSCEVRSCTTHTECDQTEDLQGTELCVEGACQQVIFSEEGGACEELYMGNNQLLDVSPENTVVIPVVTSRTGVGTAAQNQSATNNGYRLAVSLANASNALGGKKFVLVMCDDNANGVISQNIATKLLDRTNANVYLGQSLGDIATKVAGEVTKRGVFAVLNNSDIAYASLQDDDLAYRTFPSELLGLQGMVGLIERYRPVSLGLLYQSDSVVFDNAGRAIQASLGAKGIAITVGKFTEGNYETAVNTIKSATLGTKDPVEMLLLIGSTTEIPGVVGAYRAALDNKFTNTTPRMVLLGEAGFASKSILSIDPNIDPKKVELTAGALAATPEFVTLYGTEFQGAFPPTASAAFDSAILTMLIIAVSEDGATGADLKDILRTQFSTAATAEDVSVVTDLTGFGKAVSALSKGDVINLHSASGISTVFDANGDTEYPVASFSFRPDPVPEKEGFRLFRAFLPTVSIDQCLIDIVDMDCEQGYTDDPNSPGQFCTPPMQMGFPYGSCLPKCSTQMGSEIACPTGFTCVPFAGQELCAPQ